MIQFFDTNVIVQAQTSDFSSVAEPQREQERHKANDCRQLIETASDDAWMSSVTAFELLLFRSQRGVTIREAALDSVAAAVAASIGADVLRGEVCKKCFSPAREVATCPECSSPTSRQRRQNDMLIAGTAVSLAKRLKTQIKFFTYDDKFKQYFAKHATHILLSEPPKLQAPLNFR